MDVISYHPGKLLKIWSQPQLQYIKCETTLAWRSKQGGIYQLSTNQSLALSGAKLASSPSDSAPALATVYGRVSAFLVRRDAYRSYHYHVIGRYPIAHFTPLNAGYCW